MASGMQKKCSLCGHLNTVPKDLNDSIMKIYHRTYRDCEVCGTGYTIYESEVDKD